MLRPSRAENFAHGFASLSRFFPDGKALTAQLEEELGADLFAPGFYGRRAKVTIDCDEETVFTPARSGVYAVSLTRRDGEPVDPSAASKNPETRRGAP